MGRPEEMVGEASAPCDPCDPPPPYPFVQEPQGQPTPMPMPQLYSYPAPGGLQQPMMMMPDGSMYPVSGQGMAMPMTYMPPPHPYVIASPQIPQPTINVSVVNNVGVEANSTAPTSAEATIVLPDLYHDKALRLLFARKVFGTLLLQTALCFLIPSIVIDNTFTCPKQVTGDSGYGSSRTRTSNPNQCDDYFQSNTGLTFVGLVLSYILILIFTFYKSWIQKKLAVFICLGTIPVVLGCAAHVYAVLLPKEFIALYGILTAIYLLIVLFSFQSNLDFNVLWSILLVIAGSILGAILVIPFGQTDTFLLCFFAALGIGLYFALLVRNMMVNICEGGDCIGCCGCGMNLSKSSEQWPIAVVQLFFCVSIVILVAAAMTLACIFYVLGGKDNGSKYSVRIRRRRTWF